MSFKPTGLLDWILLGYGGVAVLVAVIITPLVIGLGDDSDDSSPLRVVRFSGFGSFERGGKFRSNKRYRARARRRMRRFRPAATVSPKSDPCKEAVERMISCTKDAKVQKLLRSSKDKITADCRGDRKSSKRVAQCVKRSGCAAFKRCLGDK